MAGPGNQHCASCIGTLSSLIGRNLAERIWPEAILHGIELHRPDTPLSRLTSQLPAQSTALFHFHQAVQACCVVRLIISRDGELRTGCNQGDPHDFG